MLLKLIRMTNGVGNLTLFNDSGISLFTCFTLENPSFMIPVGHYDITINTISPRFRELGERFYLEHSNGFRLPRLKVPSRNGILIHCGNVVEDSRGCILVGMSYSVNKDKPFLYYSRNAFMSLYTLLKCADSIEISII